MGALGGRWSAKERKEAGCWETGIYAWAYAFDGDYTQYDLVKDSDIRNYDIIIANTNYTDGKLFARQIHLANQRRADAKWVALVEGCASDYTRPMKLLRELFAASDFVNVINKRTVAFFRTLTATRVEYLGIPYPVENVQAYYKPIQNRIKKALICSRLLNRQNDYLVAKQLGINYYGYERRIPRKLPNIMKLLCEYHSIKREGPLLKANYLYEDKQLEIRHEVPAELFYKHNASAWMWINLDDRYTWGRYVLDAAALRIPIITTRSTGHGEDLFPETTLEDEFQVDKAVAIGKRLLCDPDFYHYVATYPIGKMEHLKHQPMRIKLLEFLSGK